MAARFFVNGGVDNNWGTAGNWATSSGGVGGAGVPTNADDVTLDNNSPNCIINTTGRVCLSLTCTNYTNTLTFNATLTTTGATGNVTLGSGMTLAGSSRLICQATGTLTSNGKTFNTPLTLGNGNATLTLADDWTVSGDLILQAVNATVTINGNTIHAQAGANCGATTNSTVVGTTKLSMEGTGTLQTQGGGANCQLNVDINTAGTITIGNFLYRTNTFKYIAGTVNQTGTLTIDSSCTFDTNTMVWNGAIVIGGTGTVTLSSDFKFSSTFSTSMPTSGTKTMNGNKLIAVGGTFQQTGVLSGQVLTGSTVLTFQGGTWAGPTNGVLSLRLPVNFESGTNTITNTVLHNGTGTITYTAGTITGSGTLQLTGSTTIDFNSGILPRFTCTNAGVQITLSSELKISTVLTLLGTAASVVLVKSNSGGTQKKLTISSSGCQLDVGYTSATDIDSNDGCPIYHFKGTITNSLNWPAFTPWSSCTPVGTQTASYAFGG